MNSTLRWHLLHLPAQADPGVHFHVKSTGVHCKCIFPRYIIRCTLRKPAQADPGVHFHVKCTGVHCKCIFPRYIIRCTLRKPARADPGLYISTLNLQVYTAETNE